uniref:Uncharacterized protein n=1 Tax=Anguilla anguilla TaxID=7936 RepID=A0A0E9THM3_ANGAN
MTANRMCIPAIKIMRMHFSLLCGLTIVTIVIAD